MERQPNEPQPDVPAKIFEAFLQALPEAGVPDEVTARLRKAMLQDGDLSESGLRAAILPEETLP